MSVSRKQHIINSIYIYIYNVRLRATYLISHEISFSSIMNVFKDQVYLPLAMSQMIIPVSLQKGTTD